MWSTVYPVTTRDAPTQPPTKRRNFRLAVHLLLADGRQCIRHQRVRAIGVISAQPLRIALRTQVDRASSEDGKLCASRSFDDGERNGLHVIAATNTATFRKRSCPGRTAPTTGEVYRSVAAHTCQGVCFATRSACNVDRHADLSSELSPGP